MYKAKKTVMWLQILLTAFCLKWTPALGQCPSKVECRSFQCPGGSYDCSYNRTSGKSFCDSYCSGPNRDPCTCLAIYKGCHIRQNAPDVIGHPTYKSVSQTTYSCVNSSGVNCGNYDLHVLSTFKGNGDIISWNNVLSTGDINVVISVSGTGNRSLVLVLLNHYPLNWILDIPNGVVIEKILLSSYHVDVSDVTYPAGSVLSVEKVANILLPSLADGFDEYGDHTLLALRYLTGRYGSVSSFTGTERADRWTLNIDRRPRDPECSPLDSHVPPSQSPAPVIAAQCHPSLLTANHGACYINSFGPTCSGDGYCRCPGMANRDECTCLVNFGSCNVEKSATGENSAGVPTYRGRTQITSSCVASDNCQNSVHVISTYQSRTDTRTGSVSLSLSFSGEDTKPLILVLTSYYAIRWTLSIPQGVTVDKVIVSSYISFVDQTSVSYPTGSVASVEKFACSRTVRCYADGYDGDTVEQLRYVSGRFGPVSTWSSAERTDTWRLHITRATGCTTSGSSTGSDRTCPVLPLAFMGPELTTRMPFGQPTTTMPFGQPTATRRTPSSDSDEAASNFAGSLVWTVIAVFVVLLSMLTIGLLLCKRCRPSRLRSTHAVHVRPNPSPPLYASVPLAQQDPTKSGSMMTSGELMDQPPPSYNVALGLPAPTKNDHSGAEPSVDPPPYTG